jgi:hypothetical protein
MQEKLRFGNRCAAQDQLQTFGLTGFKREQKFIEIGEDRTTKVVWLNALWLRLAGSG